MRNAAARILGSLCILTTSLLLAACGGGGGGGTAASSSGATPDATTPAFLGVQSIATAGGAAVRLDWQAAENQSGAAVSYSVFVAAASGGHAFGTPVATTAGTSIVLTAAHSGLIAEGSRAFYVVRAAGGGGIVDTNTVELACTPVPAAQVAFVSDTAGGAGTIGDAADPFLDIQAAIAAVEGAGGGVVLVDADAAGTLYTQELSLTTAVSSLGLFGGFARFSALPGGASGADILATRDVTGRPTAISAGNAPLVGAALVTLTNSLTPTDIDGFTIRDLLAGTNAVTGTLHFTNGSHRVTGVGTTFTTELAGASELLHVPSGVNLEVDTVRGDGELILERAFSGPTGPAAALERNGAIQSAVLGTDAALQVSCCRLVSGAALTLGTSLPTVASTVRFVGNWVADAGSNVIALSGGWEHVAVHGNLVRYRNGDLVTGTVSAPAGGAFPLAFTHNRLWDADGMANITFTPADPGNGSALTFLAERNEVRGGGSYGIRLVDMAEIGANGSVSCTVRYNLFNGTSSESIDIETIDGTIAPYAGVDTSILVHDNVVLSSDSYATEFDLGVAPGRSATLVVRDNHFGPNEDELMYIQDEYNPGDDIHDQGVFSVSITGNVGTGGSSSMIDATVGAPQGGRVHWLLTENTFRNPDDYGVELDLDPVQGTTTAVYGIHDTVYTVSIFNNDIRGGGDYEGFYYEDSRGATTNSVAYHWLGHNFAMADGDASDGAFYMQNNALEGHWLLERNVGIGSGQDDNEVGFNFEGGRTFLGNAIVLRNNIATGGFGGGFQMESIGMWMQCINNTAAYSGSEDGDHGAFSFDDLNRAQGDAQMFILNCVASHSGGQDVDYRDGLITGWSLVRDALSAQGYMNLAGEPYYAKTFTDLGFPSTVWDFADLFTLQSNSPAVDAGHPATRFNDPDGSTNDMGAYGGPGAGPVGVQAAGTTMPLAYVGMSPAADLFAGKPLMADNQVLYFGFNQPVDVSTVAANLSVRNGGVAVPGTFALASGGYVVRFTPDTVLNPTSGQIVDVTIGTGLAATAGATPAYATSFRFGVAGTPTAEVEANDDGVAGVTAADMAAAQAVAIGAGSTVFEVAGAIGLANDVDVYAVDLTLGHRLMATVVNNRAVGGTADEFDVSIYDDQGRRIRMGRRISFDGGAGNGDPYLDWIVEATGTYYVVVNINGATLAPYTLQAVVDTLD